jgi:tetratricopeptide (TPR) repeat protein
LASERAGRRGSKKPLPPIAKRCRKIPARAPLEWARTQTNLGNALARLGERENGTKLLEKAAAAYRAALEEGTRARAPLYWAGIQNNLGTALKVLGERECGAARLEGAAAAFR